MTPRAQGALLDWFDRAKRDLPWRRTRDPYAVWVSEIMLQQTRMDTAIPYFERWMARFPTFQDLAAADEQEVLSLWQGLGYYRRARNLHLAARSIQVFPCEPDDIRSLPGVGRYTAGAIASIALGLPEALVDGNVERVYARFTADPAVGGALTKASWDWAESVLVPDRPGDWNQALMELGATICTPRTPRCEACPLAQECRALALGMTEALPTPTAKPATVPLEFWAWIVWQGGCFGLRQIGPGEWWEGMWEFPRTTVPEPPLALPEAWWEDMQTIRHSVTHHRIRVHPRLARVLQRPSGMTWFGPEQLGTLPMPAPMRKILRVAMERV